MSILTHDFLKQALDQGQIKVTPPIKDEQISVASIDLHLANEFRVYKIQSNAVAVKEETDYLTLTKEVISDKFILRPQETVLGVTQEKINLAENLVGWLEGRSRFARLGLLIHISAGFIQPGVNNRQVLEITNLSPNSLELCAGEKICQLVIQHCEGKAKYQGRFKDQ